MAIVTDPIGSSVGAGSTVNRLSLRRLSFDRVSFLLVFLVVPVVAYIVLVVVPFAQAIAFSFTDWSGFSPDMDFVGVANYTALFQDSIFLKAMGNSIMLVLLLPFVTIALALVLASLVTVGGSSHGPIRGLRNSSFYRVISFFPYVIPAIVIGIMWSQVYTPNGILNGLLTGIGFHDFENFAWLGEQSTAMPATIFVIVWAFVGFYMVLFVASIKGVPAEIYEAARIDGAGRLRTALTITIPLIRGSIQTSYIYMGIFALDVFVYMAALNPGGGPNNSTLVMTQRLFTTAFTQGKFGYACAMGVLLAVITLVFAGLVFAVNRLTGGKDDISE